jgi:hypothetical protein
MRYNRTWPKRLLSNSIFGSLIGLPENLTKLPSERDDEMYWMLLSAFQEHAKATNPFLEAQEATDSSRNDNTPNILDLFGVQAPVQTMVINDVTKLEKIQENLSVRVDIHKTFSVNLSFLITLRPKIPRLLKFRVLFEADIIKGWWYLQQNKLNINNLYVFGS